MEQFTIRLDDITPDMNWDNFYKVKEILDRYNIKPLLGVVPDNQDELIHFTDAKPNFFAYILGLQKEGYAVAQHGYRHIYETQDSGMLKLNPFSEFAGISYESQLEKLQKGQQIMQEAGVHTDIFMAPGHSYDKNTIRALAELGFLYVTDGFYKKPYYKGGITFFSCTMLESYKGKGINTICFHLNQKTEKDILEFEAFIKENRNKIVDYDCETLKKFAVKKGLFVRISEESKLFIYRLKGKAAKSRALSEYMVLTDSSNAGLKMGKRLLFLPALVVIALKNKSK